MSEVPPPPSPMNDPAARKRRNRLLALVLGVVAVLFYVGISVRWSWH